MLNQNIAPTLTSAMGVGGGHVPLINSMRVRRLTPMECERLQGFPDNYTNTPTSSDSTRYKALGNSMAVPVMKWIGNRINNV
jgi:DNA (cytosine-5)-methyltransferase 1